ncbi:MAG: hypothetical protein LAO56_11545 [Acidobacteriia bacterium]|nr:hypothetical protein [Terriglobia bacterium]
MLMSRDLLKEKLLSFHERLHFAVDLVMDGKQEAASDEIADLLEDSFAIAVALNVEEIPQGRC